MVTCQMARVPSWPAGAKSLSTQLETGSPLPRREYLILTADAVVPLTLTVMVIGASVVAGEGTILIESAQAVL